MLLQWPDRFCSTVSSTWKFDSDSKGVCHSPMCVMYVFMWVCTPVCMCVEDSGLCITSPPFLGNDLTEHGTHPFDWARLAGQWTRGIWPSSHPLALGLQIQNLLVQFCVGVGDLNSLYAYVADTSSTKTSSQSLSIVFHMWKYLVYMTTLEGNPFNM